MVQTGIQTPVTGMANRNTTSKPQRHSAKFIFREYSRTPEAYFRYFP